MLHDKPHQPAYYIMQEETLYTHTHKERYMERDGGKEKWTEIGRKKRGEKERQKETSRQSEWNRISNHCSLYTFTEITKLMSLQWIWMWVNMWISISITSCWKATKRWIEENRQKNPHTHTYTQIEKKLKSQKKEMWRICSHISSENRATYMPRT